MHSAPRPALAPPGRALPLLAGMLAAAFALQVAGEAGWKAAASWSEAALGLTPAAWAAGEYWRLATHGLVHSTTNLFHLGLVLTAVLGPGAALARELGPRLPWAAFAAGQLLGGLCWLGFHQEAGAGHGGATAGAYALFAAYAVRHPERVCRVLVFFVLPLRFRPRGVLLALLGGEAFFLLIGEVLQRSRPFSLAAGEPRPRPGPDRCAPPGPRTGSAGGAGPHPRQDQPDRPRLADGGRTADLGLRARPAVAKVKPRTPGRLTGARGEQTPLHVP